MKKTIFAQIDPISHFPFRVDELLIEKTVVKHLCGRLKAQQVCRSALSTWSYIDVQWILDFPRNGTNYPAPRSQTLVHLCSANHKINVKKRLKLCRVWGHAMDTVVRVDSGFQFRFLRISLSLIRSVLFCRHGININVNKFWVPEMQPERHGKIENSNETPMFW